MRYAAGTCVAVFLGFSALAPVSHADDPCAAFTWNVQHERTLFGQGAHILAVGETTAASPQVLLDRLYQLQLKEHSALTFAAPPGGKSTNDGGYAGLATLTVDTAGVYRVALDQKVWVDAVVNGSVIPAKDFQGRAGCNAPHKIVEFALPAKTPITLQFSRSSAPTLRVTVTAAATS